MSCMNQAVLLILTASAWAQTPPTPIVSPEVHADNTVTFRMRAPNAQRGGSGRSKARKPAPMQLEDKEIWTYTSPALAPDIYGYSFNVDGVGLMDPNNSLMKPNLLNNSSAVHIPGEGLPWEDRDIPHGEVHHHFYKSTLVGRQSRLLRLHSARLCARARNITLCSTCSTAIATTRAAGARSATRTSFSTI